MSLPSNPKLETILVQAGFDKDPATGAMAVPIYQTAAYDLQNAEYAANLFGLKEEGNIYSRLSNPTSSAFESRLAALEGGVGALAFSSGHAAIFGTVANLCQAGDEIICSSVVYGGTYNLFAHTLPKFGINVSFAADGLAENFARLITPKTKALFAEVLGNPKINVLDIEAVAKVAHDHNLPLIIDATFSPYLNRSIDFGADIVVYSTTKFIDGHGQAMGGAVVDAGKFNYAGGKFPLLSEPDPSYQGLRYTDLGPMAFITRLRTQVMRDLGGCLAPMNSFLFLRGLETLHLRMERHSQNALAVAMYLQSHPQVSWVSYPGLKSHPNHALARKYFPRGAGAVLTFGIKGGVEAGRKFIDSLALFNLVANIGDTKSLVIHPASTTHAQLNESQLISAGVSADMVRLSIGIEAVEDIIGDLEGAFQKVEKTAVF
ncbi:MAG: O-acetylhomoserine aminocarboxypropyltransferase/cysteine synthase [Turicibacter sp.]|nr:O-acetylhomoserine aminocarboxypropyltransferase/cysteine synthase [Turicibacter sp.]